MAARQNEHRTDWPRGLYEPRPGYFVYRSPLSGRTIPIGREPLGQAIEAANLLNAEAAPIIDGDKIEAISSAHDFVDRRGLLDGKFIADKSMVYASICGVYFLLHNETIVYVGKSTNVMQRISNHFASGLKVFNRLFVVDCAPGNLDRLERLYIEKFKPVYNLSQPPIASDAMAWRGTVRDLLGHAIHGA